MKTIVRDVQTTKVRIKFWYKGALVRKATGTVDAFIECDERDNKDYIKNRADDVLSKMITRGLVDNMCDAGISDFGVTKVSLKFTGEPDFIF